MFFKSVKSCQKIVIKIFFVEDFRLDPEETFLYFYITCLLSAYSRRL
jgi:hypothetical protein